MVKVVIALVNRVELLGSDGIFVAENCSCIDSCLFLALELIIHFDVIFIVLVTCLRFKHFEDRWVNEGVSIVVGVTEIDLKILLFNLRRLRVFTRLVKFSTDSSIVLDEDLVIRRSGLRNGHRDLADGKRVASSIRLIGPTTLIIFEIWLENFLDILLIVMLCINGLPSGASSIKFRRALVVVDVRCAKDSSSVLAADADEVVRACSGAFWE